MVVGESTIGSFSALIIEALEVPSGLGSGTVYFVNLREIMGK